MTPDEKVGIIGVALCLAWLLIDPWYREVQYRRRHRGPSAHFQDFAPEPAPTLPLPALSSDDPVPGV